MINRAKRRRTAIRYPQLSDLDEYPLVPFLIEKGRRIYYDSSALARWIDDCRPPKPGRLFPEEPGLAFVAQLIDEAFDEFGLYMVHHKRWVLSAASNDAGKRLAREFARVLLPGTGAAFARNFARRQVRRLPYLFSVAPSGFSIPGLPRDLTPPSRAGFPETHGLLDEAWERHLAGVEAVLSLAALPAGRTLHGRGRRCIRAARDEPRGPDGRGADARARTGHPRVALPHPRWRAPRKRGCAGAEPTPSAHCWPSSLRPSFP